MKHLSINLKNSLPKLVSTFLLYGGLNHITLRLRVRCCVAALGVCMYVCIQLFRERLSEKVHATIPKGIVGGFEFSVLQRNLKELARKAMEMCFLVLKESNKSRFDSYRLQEQCIDHIPYCLSGLSRAHFSDNLS